MHLLLSKRFVRLLLITIGLTLNFPVSVFADVSLPNIFSDHMVLQQKKKNRIWGKANAGEKVTVTVDDQSHETKADPEGNWEITLDPMQVGEPRELVVRGSNEITIHDLLVGEVWICSGQSNMEWPVSRSCDYDLVKLTANYPGIRMINYPNVGSQETIWTHKNSHWMVTTPENVGSFSAVGYFFGRQIHQTLGVPVGLVNNSWGGSACEAWIRRDLLEGNDLYQPMLERYDQAAKQLEELSTKSELSDEESKQLKNLERTVQGNHRPANLYHGILKSHLGYGIRGAIWYQGESNAGRAYQYRDLFPRMISGWRQEWGQGDFPFYWVQLADFRSENAEPGKSAWAELREAQTRTMAKLSNVGEAVIIDIGEGKDIHPQNKEDVGFRLARWALANDYDIKIPFHSPTYDSMLISDGKAVLSFTHINSGGWRPFDTKQPRGFTIAGADKKFVWAEAKILEGGKIEVWSEEVSTPVAVRYAWADNPVCNMYDQAGLPLTPFRTDDWPGVTVDAK